MPDIFVSNNRTPAPSVKEKDKKQIVSPHLVKKDTFVRQALSAFLAFPEGIRFVTQEPGETIVLLLRKHWITNIGWIIVSVFLIVIPIILYPGLFMAGIFPADTPLVFSTFLVFSWYLMAFSYILVKFLLWYFTVSIITNERIIDVDFVNLLNKQFAETRISKVEDVTSKTGGFTKSFFDYGDVFLQTAATNAVFHFISVPRPDEVVKIVNQLMDQSENPEGVSS